MRSPSILLVSALLLGLSIVWSRPGPTLLIGGDAGCYARIGRELAERPLAEWLELTLAHERFFEHPPLGLWLHGLVARFFGNSPGAQVGLARLHASAVLVLLAAIGVTLGRQRERGDRSAGASESLGAFCVFGALTLPGFLYESQVAMLEAPLSVALALGIFAVARMMTAEQRRWLDVALFAVAVTLGFWVKGPPVLVLVGLLGVLVVTKRVPWRVAAFATLAGLGLAGLTVGIFEALRSARGLEPFFPTYLAHQVLPSISEGRHHPDSNPFFYVRPTLSWYGPAVGALVLALGAWRWRAERFVFELLLLGATLWGGVLVGFSIPAQKYQWYVHPGLVGAALVVGSVLALVPARFERALAVVSLVVALSWPLIRLVPWEHRLSETQRQIAALQAASGPTPAQAIADCSTMDWWVSGHLFGFLWDARRVECADPAPWRFDGTTLTAQ